MIHQLLQKSDPWTIKCTQILVSLISCKYLQNLQIAKAIAASMHSLKDNSLFCCDFWSAASFSCKWIIIMVTVDFPKIWYPICSGFSYDDIIKEILLFQNFGFWWTVIRGRNHVNTSHSWIHSTWSSKWDHSSVKIKIPTKINLDLILNIDANAQKQIRIFCLFIISRFDFDLIFYDLNGTSKGTNMIHLLI